MTGLEAVPKIAELISSLLEKARDKETLGLAKQIQTYQLVIENELKEKNSEIARMAERLKELEAKLQKPKPEMHRPFLAGESTLE